MKTMLLLFACLLLVVAPSRASTLIWGSSPGDELYTSYGAPLDDNFTFELGTFGSFIPTLANADQWLSNWKLFDRAEAPAVNGWNSGAGFIASGATITTGYISDSPYASSSVTFAEGEQVYIWAYNTLTYAQGAEWALITNDTTDGNANDNWVIPAPECCGDSTFEYRIEQATSVPLGGVNGDRGPGTFSADPPTYQLQTAAVPEPGSAMLFSSIGLLTLLRRRRR